MRTHTHTRVRACACQRKPFVGYNCEVMKVGLRGVRGDRSGVCCWRGLSQKPSIGSCHMCVSVPVCVKKIRIAKPFSPLLKTNGSLFCSRNMLRHFQNTNTLVHTHLPVSVSKKRGGGKICFAIWTSLHITSNQPPLNPSSVSLYSTHTHTQV